MPLSLAEVSGITWRTSQCSTTRPSSVLYRWAITLHTGRGEEPGDDTPETTVLLAVLGEHQHGAQVEQRSFEHS